MDLSKLKTLFFTFSFIFLVGTVFVSAYSYGENNGLFGYNTPLENYQNNSYNITNNYATSIDWANVTNKVPSDFNYLILSKWANITDAPTKLSFFTNDLGIGNWSADKSSYSTTAEANSLYYGINNPYSYYNSTTIPSYARLDANNVFGNYNQTFATDALFINGNTGNVGIGTTSPTNRFTVGGTANITGNLSLGRGIIRFNDSSNRYIYYNGSVWKDMSMGNVPAGAIMAFNSPTCPPGWIPADGTSGTPDLRGIFIRGAGTNGVLQYANSSLGYFNAPFGEYQNDSFQGHTHNLKLHQNTNYRIGFGNDSASTGYPSPNIIVSTMNIQDVGAGRKPTFTSDNDNPYLTVEEPISDSNNGAPRISYETRPASYALTYCMKTTEDSETSNTIWGGSGDSIFVQNTSKNVGIGTGSPEAKLNINTGDNTTSPFQIQGLNGTGSSVTQFYIQNSTGNVGIGTTSPSEKLVVQADYYNATTPDAKQFIIQGDTNPNNQLEMGFHTANNYSSIQSITQGVAFRSLVLNPAGGNVGIGTTDPSYQLQLSSDSAAKPSTDTWTVASDRRIKKNITYLTNYSKNLNWVENFPDAITYNYNKLYYPNLTNQTNYGFIAQDLQAYAPEMVTSKNVTLTNGTSINLLSINTFELKIRMFLAIKGLIQQNKEQQQIINNLNSTILRQNQTIINLQNKLDFICKNNNLIC